MSQKNVPVNRRLVGVLTIACFAGAVGIGFYRGAGFVNDPLCAALFRTSLLLGAFWLALPSRKREAAWANISPWRLAILMAAAVLFVWRPRRFGPIIAVLAVAALFLRPKNRAG